jgi:hypothetical protein
MKYDLRIDEAPFPALPEKEAITAVTPSAPTRPPSPLAELAIQYEREVFDLVRNSLDQGQSEDTIVATLVSNDFAADEARIIVRAVIEDRALAGDALDREVFVFVSDHLNRGTDEDVIVREVCEFGLNTDVSRMFVRSVSALSLAECHRPELLHLVADLEDAGKTPKEIVEELERHDLPEAQCWRLLRDRNAMMHEVLDGRAAMNRGTQIMVVCVVLAVLGCFVLAIFFAIGPFFWGSKMHARGKLRVNAAMKLLYPPLPADGP